ncbi:MAG: mobile mystery protein A [Porticoccaceae bacterium]
MSIKKVVLKQYREIMNRAGSSAHSISFQKEGWIKTARTALGMSVRQLADRLGVTRGYIYKAENAELEGGLTLKKMHEIAEAMDCQFVYAIVPAIAERTVEGTIEYRARKMALEIEKKTHANMALEAQSLSWDKREQEIERIVEELKDDPSVLWDKK